MVKFAKRTSITSFVAASSISVSPMSLDARRRLGDLVLEEGLATRNKLDRALAAQRKSGGQLGDVLVAAGVVREGDLRRLLARQLGIPFVDLADRPPDEDVVRALPRHVCERATALPVAVEGDHLIVAVADTRRTSSPSTTFAWQPVGPCAPCWHRRHNFSHASRSAFEDETSTALDEALLDEVDDFDDDGLLSAAEDAPIVRFVDGLLARGVRDRASDVHIEAVEDGLDIRFRIDGVLRPVMKAPRPVRGGVISRLKIMASLDIAERRMPQDERAVIAVDTRRIDLRVRVAADASRRDDRVALARAPTPPASHPGRSRILSRAPRSDHGRAPRRLRSSRRVRSDRVGQDDDARGDSRRTGTARGSP